MDRNTPNVICKHEIRAVSTKAAWSDNSNNTLLYDSNNARCNICKLAETTRDKKKRLLLRSCSWLPLDPLEQCINARCQRSIKVLKSTNTPELAGKVGAFVQCWHAQFTLEPIASALCHTIGQQVYSYKMTNTTQGHSHRPGKELGSPQQWLHIAQQ